MKNSPIDIVEDKILFDFGEEVLLCLLREHAYDKLEELNTHNIYWATDNYEGEGEGFHFFDEIQVESITGRYKRLVRPRADKSKDEQELRKREKAEVFTPSWVCNAQNNLVDNAWFGRENVFNTEIQQDEIHIWKPTESKIEFPPNKTWQEYVSENRLEITCGEAPYLVSRYDTTTGQPIDELPKRIGLLDRKMRIVAENVTTQEEWYKWAFNALKSTYGFEWQGDSLLLAREAILFTFLDYYKDFATKQNLDSTIPTNKHILFAAKIISWNIFQMDGLKFVLPMSCHDETVKTQTEATLFSEPITEEKIVPCRGCKMNDANKHNGIYQLVAEWNKEEWSFDEEPMEIIKFHSLLSHDRNLSHR